MSPSTTAGPSPDSFDDDARDDDQSGTSGPPMAAGTEKGTEDDRRLYVTQPDNSEIRIKPTWEKEYCHGKNPGEDYFHLLICGEIYVIFGHEKYCLNCALRRGLVTRNRLRWQQQADTSRKPL